MLDVNQVKEVMRNRGFCEQAIGKHGDQIASITFNTMRLDGTDIACIVDIFNETFKFEWCVPYSINRLITPDCSSLFNESHFYKLYRKMLKHARILNYELQE